MFNDLESFGNLPDNIKKMLFAYQEKMELKFAYDIHDAIGSNLSALCFLSTTLNQQQPDLKIAQEINKIALQANDQIRHMCKLLAPPELKSKDLSIILGLFSQNIANLYSINCSFRHLGQIFPFNKESIYHLYRISQEAVTNAILHGKAHKIELELQTTPESFLLSIKDNGQGLKNQSSKFGMGLTIMKERANEINSSLTIDSKPGQGTILTISNNCSP